MSHSFDDTVVIPRLKSKLPLVSQHKPRRFMDAQAIDLSAYDIIIVCMSGGKDSIASLLCLVDMGVDMSKVELWHHEVDGREGSELIDWPFMRDYNVRLAEAFCVPIYFSWLEGGMEGELLKDNSFSHPHHIQTPTGELVLQRDKVRGKPGTRLRFPQQSASLATRWCSSALKIDLGRRALANQDRFNGRRVLFITGERREESPGRSKYAQFERHPKDCRDGSKARHVCQKAKYGSCFGSTG